MKSSQPSRFAPNLERKGRLIRAAGALALLAGAAIVFPLSRVAAVALAIGGLFVLFEAARGWCLLRACRIRTPF